MAIIFDINVFSNPKIIEFIIQGLWFTIFLTIGGLSLGFAVGSTLAFMEVYSSKPISTIARIIGEVFRGIPLIVLFLLLYFGLPNIGVRLTAIQAAILGLGIRSAAYQSQIFRGSLEAVGRSQLEAALSIGMTPIQAYVYILLPQALRISIPAWTNEFTIVLKDTSIAYVLGILEIMTRADLIARSIGRYLEVYIIVALMYFLMVAFVNKVFYYLYEKYRIPGLGGVEAQ